MEMRIVYSVPLFLIILFIFLTTGGEVLTDEKAENITQELNKTFYTTTMNITEEGIPYKNLYVENYTFADVIMNIANPIVYSVVAEANTLVPVGIDALTTGKRRESIRTIALIILIGIGISFCFTLIKGCIILWFWNKERKRNGLKIYE